MDPYYNRPGYNNTVYETDEYKVREYERDGYPRRHHHLRPDLGYVRPAEQAYSERVTDVTAATPYGVVERRDERETYYDDAYRRRW